MAREWTMSTLGNIADPSPHAFVDGPFGSNLPASKYTDSGVPIVRGSNLALGETRFRSHEFVFVSSETAHQLRRSLCKPLDVIFTKKGTLGQTGIIPEHGRFSQYLLSGNQMKLTVNRSKADPLFVFYWVSSPASRAKITKDSEVTGVPKTNLTYLRTFPISLPPLPEQQTIAAILGAFDDKIELNRRMNATLEAMARALFQSWFVDFDPVRAKLDGRQPPGLDRATADLFPAYFDHDDVGLIPVGWRREAIENLCSLNSWTLSKTDVLETIEYIEISEVNHGDIANLSNYLRGEEPGRARRRLQHGDTVISTVRPDRGAYFLALNPPDNRVASTGFAVLTPTAAPWSLIHAAMTQEEFFEHLGRMADGGAYPAVRPEIIGALQLVVPDDQRLLNAFHNICAPLYEKAEQNRLESRTLANLRDALLPKLLSGEIRVPAAAEVVKAAQ